MTENIIVQQQKEVCAKYGANFCESNEELKVGIALNLRENILPINGLRISPEGDTTGWYIWAGDELSQDPDFFEPLHVEHIDEWVPGIKKYLGLPPGWRFLIAGDYEDVWYDSENFDDL